MGIEFMILQPCNTPCYRTIVSCGIKNYSILLVTSFLAGSGLYPGYDFLSKLNLFQIQNNL